MYLETTENLIKRVAERWKEQYYTQRNNFWYNSEYNAAEKIYNKLLTATTAQEIDNIIGNDSWTNTSFCMECGSYDNKPRVWLEEEDGESCFSICESCLDKAAKLFKDLKNAPDS